VSGGRSRAWLWGAVGVVVVAAGIVAAVVSAGGGGSTSSSGHGHAGGTVEIASRVTVQGAPLPTLPDSGSDPAVGRAAPTLVGVTFSGAPLTVTDTGQPFAVVFVAHWCPHCQAEVPRIVALARSGQIPVPVVGVATGTDPAAPNYPPSAWLAREHWPFPVLVDTSHATAATAYGLPAYPFLVFVDAHGAVAGRLSGEIAASDLAKVFAALGAGRPLPIPGTPGASSGR
jgi:thiol-disulfide isomerase/thioredoxin